jgi:SNF family Na+-dependent transporter
MAAIQTLITTLEDFFPFLKKTARIKAITLAVVCTIFFLIGYKYIFDININIFNIELYNLFFTDRLLFCSRAGSYWIEIFDNYSANWGIFLVAIFQCVCVAWLYGIKRYETDVTAMIPDDSLRLLKFTRYAFVWWRVTWQFVTPILLFVRSSILFYK